MVYPSPYPFPSGKGRLGVAGYRNLLRDHLQHSVHVPQHLVVPEADHAVAVDLDQAGSISICGAVGMLPAVEFDCEVQGAAGEVCDEVANGKLPGELRALKLACAQVHPQPFFGFGSIIAQVSREARQSLFRHRGTPIPNPFPQGKGLLVAKLS